MPRPRSVPTADNGGLIPKGSLSAEEETYTEEAFHVRVKSKKLSLYQGLFLSLVTSIWTKGIKLRASALSYYI